MRTPVMMFAAGAAMMFLGADAFGFYPMTWAGVALMAVSVVMLVRTRFHRSH